MKIAFDARWIKTSNLESLGGYALNLLIYLLKNNQQNRYLILFDREDRQKFIERTLIKNGVKPLRYDKIKTFSATAVFSNWFILPRVLAKYRVNRYFSPNYIVAPFFKKYKLIAMVPDLAPLFLLEYRAPLCIFLKFIYRFPGILKIILKRCDLIVTLTKNIKQDLIDIFNLDPTKIIILRPGIAGTYFKAVDSAKLQIIKKIYALPAHYILYIGKHERAKNLKTLIKAYHNLPAEIKKKNKLLIGGSHANAYAKEMDALVADLKLTNEVFFPGYIAPAHQPAIMQSANCFVYLSSYEGFPNKIFEALASNLPVIASKQLVNLCQSSILAINPSSTTETTAALKTLLVNHKLAQQLSQNGQLLIKNYRWDQTARQLLKNLANLT